MSTLNVAMDMTFANRNRGGSGIYARSLLGALRDREDLAVRTIQGPRRSNPALTMRWLTRGARRALDNAGAQLLHCPTFVAPWRMDIPTVITVHDAATSRFPRDHPLEWRFYVRVLMPRRLRAAHRIIAVSEFAKTEVISVYGVDPNRVVVVWEGVDARFLSFVPNGESEDTSVIVFPGAPLGRKNLDIVLKCMAATPSLAKASLRITGAAAKDFPQYVRMVRDLGLGDRVQWLGDVALGEMPGVYSRASVVVYPSLYEGFGFPPLEAMAVGTPVVASNRASLPEVLGDAAILVDPTDPRAVSMALDAAIANPDMRKKLREQGRLRAQAFSWQKCADRTIDVYKEVVASRKPN